VTNQAMNIIFNKPFWSSSVMMYDDICHTAMRADRTDVHCSQNSVLSVFFFGLENVEPLHIHVGEGQK